MHYKNIANILMIKLNSSHFILLALPNSSHFTLKTVIKNSLFNASESQLICACFRIAFADVKGYYGYKTIYILRLLITRPLTLSWGGYFMYVGWGVVQNYPKS